MKKILIGTTNPAKVRRFEALLAGYDVEFCTLKDLGVTEEPEERGSTPEENAILKAAFYGKYFDAVICNDSGLYFDGLPMDDGRQPGLNVRTPNGGPRLDDEELLQYYIRLVRSLGGKALAYYLDGIAVYHHGTISSYMEDGEATRHSAFYLVDRPAPERREGWPLDSISLNRNTLTYFVHQGNNKYDSQEENIMLGQYRERLVRFLAQALALHTPKGEITMAKQKPRTLSGFMELLPPRQAQFDRMVELLRQSYSRYGFTPLDTPVIESSEVLLAKGGGETEKQIYRFQKGDADLSLRFDLTVPLAKYVALHYNDLTFPFRRFQIGKVYRGERAQRGRFREFYQADIDVIGDGKLSILNEAEIPAIIYKTFSALGLRRFRIRVNNRKILNGFYASLDLADKAGDIMRTVGKLEKIGPEKVREILTGDLGVRPESAQEILDFITITGGTEEILSALEARRGRNEVFDQGVEELGAVVRYLGAFGVPVENFAVDLTIARGLDYYTGTVYETVLLDHPEIGSVCSGGRYDNLAEYYTDKQLPGVGISIGLTRLFYVLGEQGMLNPELNTAPADALILPMTEDLSAAIAFATELRENGIRAQLHCEEKKFKQKISYADKLGIPYVIFLGEDEIQAGVVACKDMLTGEQTKLDPKATIYRMKAGLDARNQGSVIRE